MEWVIALLAVGCLFFAFQSLADYFKYKRVIAPRIQRLEAAKEELKTKIQEAKAHLEETRGQLGPLKGEINLLEKEYHELQQQVQEEQVRHKYAGNGSDLPPSG